MNKLLLGVPVIAGSLFATALQGQVTVEQATLIDEGFRVFTEETFRGNGRTCATCHVPAEGYNIFPSTIAKLKKKERDPVFAVDSPGLENVALIEARALFNISGGPGFCPADDPSCFERNEGHSGPIFRASMNIEALELTTRIKEMVEPGQERDFKGTLLLPLECSEGVELELPQLGWSGDGSPGTPKGLNDEPGFDDGRCQEHHGHVDLDADGSVRAFAAGAIAQHFTLSLARTPGVDFRRGTAEELDALEAFQLWLGRRALTEAENAMQGTENASEFDILLLDFKDPRVALGRDHFESSDGATCNRCHTNGGALGGGDGGNNNTITSVSLASVAIGERVVGVPLPDDEGTISSAFSGGDTGELLGAFNTQSIIESAEKKAWFHNHKVVEDFEEAIAHYGSDDFLVRGPNGRPIGGVKPEGGLEGLQFGGQVEGAAAFPDGDGIEHLGAFLRALNAFYNLRDCERLIGEAGARFQLHIPAGNPIQHCMFNLDHVERVLSESKLPNLHRDVQKDAKKLSKKLKGLQKQAEKAQGKNKGMGDKKDKKNEDKKIEKVEAKLHEILASIFAMRSSIATQLAP